MGIKFEVVYHEDVVKKDIAKLSSVWKRKIQSAIEEKLTSKPEVFGKPLRKSLKGYRRLRVGDYRVIFRIQGKKILVLLIEHRSVVYKSAENRF